MLHTARARVCHKITFCTHILGLDGLEIESPWGARFSALVQTGPGANPTLYTLCTGSFLGGKAAEAWR